MLWYCLMYRKNTDSKNSKIVWTKNGRVMLLSRCAACDKKESKINKMQENW